MNHLERMQAQAQKRLPKEENIIYCVPSDYRQTDGGGTVVPMGMMAATEKRIFYISTGLIGFTMEEFPFESISRISYSQNAKGDTLSIFTRENQAVLKWSMLSDVSQLVDFAKENIGHEEKKAEISEFSKWQALKLAAAKTNGMENEYHHRKIGINAKY